MLLDLLPLLAPPAAIGSPGAGGFAVGLVPRRLPDDEEALVALCLALA